MNETMGRFREIKSAGGRRSAETTSHELAQRLSMWEQNAQSFLSTPDGYAKLACGIKVAKRIMKKWGLEDGERPSVFQQESPSEGATYSMTDTVITVSLLLSLYGLLLQYHQDEKRCQQWLRWHDPALTPHTPASLISQGIQGLFQVRQLLAERCT